ncbi:17.4 kDa class III heat shock protein [Thalictrum thalictroides]|uniref:17.4 kDa class III heat shock protein n=1 Tax=Thalictrum thalictroides TaxID=46969 RepID=A0A7J6VV05_THATH|nr:17.4 kDa class III heat shock protein [Thalictrum thalictroides]
MRVRYPLPLRELILTAVDALKAKNAPTNRAPISEHIEASYGHVVRINSTLLNVHLKAMLNTGKLILVNNNYLRPPPPPSPSPSSSSETDGSDDAASHPNSEASSSTSTSSSQAAADSMASPIVNENENSTENESFHLLNTDDKSKEKIKGIPTMTVNILESSKDYVLLCDVPGLTKPDMQVTVENGKTLLIQSTGDRKRKREDEERKYIRLEKEVSPKFSRKFLLPTDSNLAAISAKCENGLLTVSVEKLPQQPQAKTFEVAIS